MMMMMMMTMMMMIIIIMTVNVFGTCLGCKRLSKLSSLTNAGRWL